MIILSNGYKLPETGDFGDVWFPALEDNITRLNGHNHDGSNSSKIPATSITGLAQTVTAGDFSVSGDRFRALVTLAGGAVDIDNKTVIVRDPTTKNPIHLDIEKVTSTQIYVYAEITRTYEVLVI